jgi:uncharacterized protein (DUF1800 family)
MADDPTRVAAFALHRFGLGPRPGGIAAIASDPRGALIAELDRPGAGRIDNPNLMTSAQAARAGFEARAARQAQNVLAQRARKEAEQTASAQGQSMADEAAKAGELAAKPVAAPPVAGNPPIERQIFLQEAKARFDAALLAEIGLAERLVWFWSNHFCVSRAVVPNMAGGYEREAIRPHILGRFVDLVLAVEGHPAMLAYLNNQVSIGPNSVAGINRERGLNENLAREILELHTLGVRTVYSQADVTNFAKVLTGWTILPPVDNPEHGSEFVFNPRLHEPGPEEVIGKTYSEAGVEQGRAVLTDIARHPATATHIATKLARHFAADDPPQALIDRLAGTFRDSDGDLKAVTKALITSPEPWAGPRDKLKKPSEWLVALARVIGAPADPQRFVNGQALLGEPLWQPSAPQGFADVEAAWIDGVGARLDIANNFSQRIAGRSDPDEVLAVALGPLASKETQQAIALAESRQQALTLAFMSPEFQRR